MNITILDRASLGYDTHFSVLERFGTLTFYDKTPPELLEERLKDTDVAIINKIKMTDAVFSKAKKLKLVCVFATGYDNVDIAAARAHNVAVCNVPAYSTESVTLFTVATVLALVSHLFEYDSFVKSGNYTTSGVPNRLTPVFHNIKDKVWGIIGYGNIGKSVANVARSLGAKVIVNRKSNTNDSVDLDTLCRHSDIISIHCPLNDETRGIINRRTISLMKPNVVLVNEARGGVLDELAVAQAVLSGQIGAFGCDVYSEEPFGEKHPYSAILDNNNVILTPHAAWASYEAREKCVNIIADNIQAFLSGEVLNRVDLL